MARLLRQKDEEIEQLQRKLMFVTNFPSHPGGHPDDQSGDAMVPADWRHGWICAVAAIQEAIGGNGSDHTEQHLAMVSENKQMRELLFRWMSTQEGDEPVTPELLEETDAAISTEAVVNQPLTTGETSDGYHTFNELYEHRHALFLNLMSGIGYDPWISKLHHDGTGLDGWFISGVDLPTGTISYHLPERLWDAAVFTGAALMERAPEWDGHTSDDVVSRLYQMVAPYKDLWETQND